MASLNLARNRFYMPPDRSGTPAAAPLAVGAECQAVCVPTQSVGTRKNQPRAGGKPPAPPNQNVKR